MIDFVLGLFFAGLFVRGWLRGFVKELMDLVGLIIGIVFSFRLSEPMGEFIMGWTGLSAGPSRLVGGVVVFLGVGIVAAFGAHYLGRVMNLPGLKVTDRALGAALGFGLGLVPGDAGPVDSRGPAPAELRRSTAMEESALVDTLTNPELPTQEAFHALAGDRVLETVLALQRLVGNKQIILEEGEQMQIDPAEPSELADAPLAAQDIFVLLNKARVDAGEDPLAWSDALAEVGQSHATEMYLDGYFSHVSPKTGTIGNRLAAESLTYRLAGENLALAASPDLVHEGLMGSPDHRANIVRPEFRRVGIGVVRGPAGAHGRPGVQRMSAPELPFLILEAFVSAYRPIPNTRLAEHGWTVPDEVLTRRGGVAGRTPRRAARTATSRAAARSARDLPGGHAVSDRGPRRAGDQPGCPRRRHRRSASRATCTTWRPPPRGTSAMMSGWPTSPGGQQKPRRSSTPRSPARVIGELLSSTGGGWAPPLAADRLTIG